jgi:hypothetical protein
MESFFIYYRLRCFRDCYIGMPLACTSLHAVGYRSIWKPGNRPQKSVSQVSVPYGALNHARRFDFENRVLMFPPDLPHSPRSPTH